MNNPFLEIKKLLPFEIALSLSEIVSVSSEAIEQLSDKEKSELEQCKSLRRQSEFVTSRITLKEIAGRIGAGQDLEILKDELGQPYGKNNSHKFFVSIAHTNNFVFCGLASKHPFGVDLEPVDRTVSDKLEQRITHPKETEILNEISLIRLWTIKEAYIKLRGQGLRMNMNEVQIKRESDWIFVKINNDKRAKICSFRLKNNWLAIAYYH
ncbi:4'-phosphopantetheinyl transferase family protein [Fodinibius sp.]|uniref:4'-phosphopantetheinyl transferase family protein n=1 Tax=Fodinibius sp. TaxID=1872440 RepID=UPI002ACE8454|nr:4'-phosphopantetheinyl transferase superfamily protein [Fodinibius sp.]MDZ7660181.1 4'-phosphopantetheinyl transferase superfamily protein [Fodinibius sp.]